MSDSDVFKVPQFPAAPAPQDAAKPPEPPEPPCDDDTSEPEKNEVHQQQQAPRYKEPPDWGPGEPPSEASEGGRYFVEELKSGAIVKKHELTGKSFFVIGRLPANDIQLEHPSLSRQHAVLQFKARGTGSQPAGFYLYDLGSAHGSFHNKRRCFPETYYRLRVGHVMKFGGSTRLLILQGPGADAEEESDLTVTELKALAAERARKRAELERREREKREAEEAKGIGWGMDEEHADEKEEEEEEDRPPDMTRNPFSVIREGEGLDDLRLSDPKRTLRNWFEREGFDAPDYQCSEVGYAHFRCALELPVDDEATGKPLAAEVRVKGRKKEAEARCALEACRILDRAGMLRSDSGPRQSRESLEKMRRKKLEEDDFYASDEDEFLDRTGALETKRRMRKGSEGTADTFESLTRRGEALKRRLEELRERLKGARKVAAASDDVDLDSYVQSLKDNADGGSKEAVTKLKLQLTSAQKELSRVEKLVEIARPTRLPQLKRAEGGGAPKQPSIKSIGVKLPTFKTVAAAPAPSEPRPRLAASTLDAFKDDEDDEAAAKPKLPSLAEFKKELLRDAAAAAEEEEGSGERRPEAQKRSSSETAKQPKKPKARRTWFKEKSYAELAKDDVKYENWAPPVGQTGDGRTSLNDKLGY